MGGDGGMTGGTTSEHSRVRRLYEVGRQLAVFTSIDQTLPAMLAVATETLPLASAILIVETSGEPHFFRWARPGLSEEDMRASQAHARAAYDYLVHAPRTSASTLVNALVETSKPFLVLPIVLPLVVKR